MDTTRLLSRAGAVVLIAFAALFALYEVWIIIGSLNTITGHVENLPALYHDLGTSIPDQHENTASQGSASEVALVVASIKKDNTTWIREFFSHWDLRIYVVDDHSASNLFQTPRNKGRESTVYLTHIIDNYENLPNINIFHHADRYQWHTDDPLYDGKRLLEQLQLPYVEEQGFASLKCSATFSCKSVFDPDEDAHAGDFWWGDFESAFEIMFPGETFPDDVAATCCAEFAATRQQILKRPRSDYIRYRDWLLNTDLTDHNSGRIMEYVWHMIFFRSPVYCPEPKTCYCKTYGLCDLECEEDGNCPSQYTAPLGLVLPEGWPDYDFAGNRQNVSTMI